MGLKHLWFLTAWASFCTLVVLLQTWNDPVLEGLAKLTCAGMFCVAALSWRNYRKSRA